ncbi:hypothetical protein [Actinocorallia sp. A-T 12471]|uniref:hypothetical protein n=1 Tax=Actinocorallia sp. A-T 12471 TaxID=3089813 RepID=UPI0029D284A3|nr:hypothetical protein [Actinocorallia sp. A-T 12471]MDX6741992.1 hypothetical protein [Actinocorallia sp. A-T 12471]
MRVRLGFLAVWTATTAAGVGITWVGVGDAMRGTALPVPDAAASVPVFQGRPPTATPEAAATIPLTPAPTRPPRPTPKTSTPKTQTPEPPKPTRPEQPPSPKPSPAPQGEVRTYVVASGRVVLSFTEDSAKLVSATPDSGFEVKVWRQTEWLRVDLTDGVRGSAVFATWNGHPPMVEVYEY